MRESLPRLSLPAIYADLTGIGREDCNPDFRGSFVSPAVQEATAEIVAPSAAAGERARFLVCVYHLTTPRSPTSHYYWWLRGRNFGSGPGVREQL